MEKIDVLLAAVRNSGPWLERFTRNSYTEAFQAYAEQFVPDWLEAVRSAGEEGLPALAEALLDGMEEDWGRLRFWKRTSARLDVRQMLVQYLSPMLLEQEEPGCRRLAELIREGWTIRRPKEAYSLATCKKLQKGFRYSILGIPLPERQREED